ncbi:hypothetical protein [Streptomyces colonosanans]|uniref:hypothetical protein n=1 Tax=Streptomyces colonosanans TaxID=1428652 RepID=UPI000A4D3DBD|nr:hypothetical protein [Streptomyces colonosanans]
MNGLHIPTWNSAAPYIVALAVSAWLVRRGVRSLRGRATPAIWVAALAAIGCTAYSADTSWRFAADYLDMGGTAERVAMFAAAELALFANSLLARQNLNGPNGTPGAPGVLVWVITGVQIIPAYAESGVIGGTVRAFVGPVMAAMLWHLAMGIELRHHKPGAASHGLAALVGRELRERLLSRLGLAEQNRDAAQITRDRATVRAVKLAARLAAMTPVQRGRRSGQRLNRRLSAAVARACVGADPEQRRKLLDLLAARRHAAGLATVELPSPWEEVRPDPAASALAAQTREQMHTATARIRSQAMPRMLFPDVVPVRGVDSGERSSERPELDEVDTEDPGQPPKLTTEEARTAIEEGWANGLSVRDTATLATRAPSYVHNVFVKLDKDRGPRPVRGQLSLVNGHDAQADASDPDGA